MTEHEFSERVSQALIRARLTDAHVDACLGLPPGTCEGWTTGRPPKPDEKTVVRLALKLRCDPEYLDTGLSPVLRKSMDTLVEFAGDNRLSEIERDDLWEYGWSASHKYRHAISYEEWSRLWAERKGASGPNPYTQPRLPGDF